MIKRLFSLALLFALLLSGCTGQEAGGPPAPEDGDLTQLSWYINFSWFASAWEDNLVANTITQETGTTIDFVKPSGNEREKLTALMSAGTMPDLITLGHWEPELEYMIEEGLVYPLNELAEDYAPEFFQVAEPQRLAWYTRPDGNIYGYPNASYTPADYQNHQNIGANQTFLVRKDIYEALGSPDMTTPEGFQNAVMAAAAQFPQVEGEPLIPIGLYEFNLEGCYSLEEILMNFLAIPFEKDGQKYDRYTDPDYITWLKTFRALGEAGCLSNDIFVDRRAQTSEKAAQGRYFCMLYQHTDIADQQKLLYAKDPDSIYIAVDGPKNARGDDHTLPGVGINGWTVTLISKSCKNPEAAIKMMTYMMGPHGQKILYCGVEGVTYDMVDGKVCYRPEVLALLGTDRVEYNRRYGADNTYWMLQDSVMQLDWQPPLDPQLNQPRIWTFPYTIYAAQYDVTFPPGSQAADIHQRIREEWGKTLPRLLLAKSETEFDAIFSHYLATRDSLGFALVQEEATRQMVLAKERLAAIS